MAQCIRNPEMECLGLAEAKILEKRISDLEDWKKKSSEFHEVFYNWQRDRIDHDARLDEQIISMSTNITKLVEWQEDQRQKPEKRWESVLIAILGIVAGFVLKSIGIT